MTFQIEFEKKILKNFKELNSKHINTQNFLNLNISSEKKKKFIVKIRIILKMETISI